MTPGVTFAATDATVAATFLGGAWLGLSIAMPVGPTSLLCMSRTLSSGPAAGLATGLAAALVHVTLSVASATVVTHVPPPTAAVAQFASILGAVVLLSIAWRTLRSPSSVSLQQPNVAVHSFASALVYCASNPVTWLLIATASPAALDSSRSGVHGLAAGIFVGSFGWWCCLTGSVASLRRALSVRVASALRVISATVLVCFALRLLLKIGASTAAPYCKSASRPYDGRIRREPPLWHDKVQVRETSRIANTLAPSGARALQKGLNLFRIDPAKPCSQRYRAEGKR